ncbi:hypothetical protein [Klebsiella pneumoniae]|uniref:hypothetical protein n=1 Tax=Klebsiella pneumoniae TaxID=573 RepID=UPI0034D6B65E
MTDITELALITKIKKQLENFDTVILKDDEALALVETLEKAQQLDEELCRLLPPGSEYMDPPDGGDVTPLEGVRRMVADYRQRIAELEESHAQVIQSRDHYKRISGEGLKQLAESSTVTVKLTDINEYLAEVHDKTLNRAFRLLAEGVRAGDVAAMRAAGIKVEQLS